MKNSSDTIGNRTSDLPACSAVPQPSAPLRAPGFYISKLRKSGVFVFSLKNMNNIQTTVIFITGNKDLQI